MPPASSNVPPQSSNNASTSSVRRNLFSTHLSRRPASATTTTSHTFDSPLPPPLQFHQPHSHPRSSPSPPFPPSNSTDILARSPTTGRPILPHLPTLPAHLSLSPPSDSADPVPAALDQLAAHHQHHALTAPAVLLHARAHSPAHADTAADEASRIEKSLVEMMYRSRGRAHGHAMRRGAEGEPRLLEPESAELLALVQSSLRKKVAGLEEDRWMYEGEKGARER